ncbi:hypothetical protein [Rhodopseudomonas sp.]|uniref:hypothetical protein n=1 Tax=Rhodopseudomonas sp. TaxID=1078 RepID=UPI0039E22B93
MQPRRKSGENYCGVTSSAKRGNGLRAAFCTALAVMFLGGGSVTPWQMPVFAQEAGQAD